MAVALAPPKYQILVPPMRGERQDSYVERADRALQKRIVDRNSRMSQILRDWSASGEEAALQQRARNSLAAVAECTPEEVEQHFVIRRNRPIFPEHETIDATGQVQRYDRAALGAIVDRCNKRIMETGDLAAMSAGHTPTSEQQASGMKMPPMVGFTGPFRLGIINDQAPKWCIFADEAVFKDDWNDVRKMPRRSPEVWMTPNVADRVMDPIAVLGSETPRLDTGVARFSRKMDAERYRNVTRYSMGAACFPSGSNTFTQKYSEFGGGSMDPETIQSVVSAVMQGIAATPQWQYLTDQMQAGQNPIPESADGGPTPGPAITDPTNPTGAPADPSLAGAPPMGADMSAAAGAPPTDQVPPSAAPGGAPLDSGAPPSADAPVPMGGAPAPAPAAAGGDDTGASPDELASMKDDEKDQYSKLSPTHQYGYMAARRRHFKPGAPMQYSNGVEKDRYARVELENKTLRGEVQALRVDRTYRERYSKLQELGQIHEFDIQVEADECKAMTDADFEKHCNRIVSRYSRRDPNGGMPTLHLEPLEREASVEEAKVERYSNRAVQIATQSGGKMSWNEALEAAKLELK